MTDRIMEISTLLWVDITFSWPTIFGFVGALLMGLSLGLIGGGGSILTVPILVKLFAVP